MDIFNTPPKNGMTFNYKGTPIDPELRPLWRIALITLILQILCSGQKANSKKLQTLYSLASSEKKRNIYNASVKNINNDSYINLRFDPLVDKAVDIGIGEGIFILDSSKNIKLTEKGVSFAKKIEKDNNIFIIEKNFMKQFNKSYFTEKVINNLISGVAI